MKVTQTRKWKKSTIGCVLLGLTSVPIADAIADDTVGVVLDTTYGQLAGEWWQWAERAGEISGPAVGSGPIDCSYEQDGDVWFLAGTFGTKEVRICKDPIPADKALFFPLVNLEIRPSDCLTVDPEWDDCTVEERRELADGLFSDLVPGVLAEAWFGFGLYTCQLSATLDGVPVTYMYPSARVQSSTTFWYVDDDAIADGYWIALPALPKGRHTINFTGALCEFGVAPTDDPVFGVDVTYKFSVKDVDESDDDE